MHPYIKSVVWLIGFGGAGYVLMELTKPSQSKLDQIRASSNQLPLSEQNKQKALFLQKLKEAADPGTPPAYLKAPKQ